MPTHDDAMNMIISADELFRELEEASSHAEYSITVINVLSPKQFDNCHIEDSINIEAHVIGDEIDDWDRTRAIVLYCAGEDPTLSRLAYTRLVEMGFTDVQILEGGLQEWVDCGYPTDGVCEDVGV